VDLGDTSFEDGERLLAEINEAEKMKKESLQTILEEHLGVMGKEYIFDIGEDSDEAELMTEEELEA
jgi:hypothetical protein